MSKAANAMRLVIAILLAVLVSGAAVAQQNPFVGTWGESGRTLNGKGIYAAYWDFYPNGTMHSSGGASGAGPIHAYAAPINSISRPWKLSGTHIHRNCAPRGASASRLRLSSTSRRRCSIKSRTRTSFCSRTATTLSVSRAILGRFRRMAARVDEK